MSLEDVVDWTINTSPFSEDSIMIAEGVAYLTQVTAPDSKTYWYDRWSQSFETTINDQDIIACGTVGPYQGRTVMAIVRDVRALNSDNRFPAGTRWIIHICRSALVDVANPVGGMPPLAMNLLEATKTILFEAPHMYPKYMNFVGAESPRIDMFLGIDWILLTAFLKIEAAETFENDPANPFTGVSPGSTAITDSTSWSSCLVNPANPNPIILMGLMPSALSFNDSR